MQANDPKTLLEKSIPIVAKMGIKVVEFGKNHAKLKLPFEGNANHIDIVYAGSLFTLGELAGGAIFHASFDNLRYYPVVKKVEITFKRMALTDVTVEVGLSEEKVAQINQTAEARGKADFDLSLELKDNSGEVCCLVDGVWQIRKLPETGGK